MKITKLEVNSFGAVNGFFADLSDSNFTLIYGDNEAGKSTLTEFIRSTLFPSARSAKYPVSKKTDQGRITLEMSDGGTRILEREHRKVTEKDGKLTPDVEFHMDSDTFRSLFALDLDQLTNDKLLSNGEFRKKFLTVPGGEHVPEVNKEIHARMDSLMNRSRLTDSKVIGHLYREVRRLTEELDATEDDADLYDELNMEKSRLLMQLGEAKNASRAAAYEENREKVMESIKENMARLEEMKAAREQLSDSDSMTDEDVVRYSDLRSRLSALDDLIDGSDDDDDPDTMGIERAKRIMELSGRIESVWSERDQMGFQETTLADLRKCYQQDMEDLQELLVSCGYDLEDAMAIRSDLEIREVLLNPDNKKKVSDNWGKVLTKRSRILVGAVELASIGAGAAVALTTQFTALGCVLALAGAVAAAGTWVFPRFFKRFCRMGTDWAAWLPAHGFRDCTDPARAEELLRLFDQAYDMDKRMHLTESRMQSVSDTLETLCEDCREICRELEISNGSLNEDLNDMYSQYVLAKSTLQVNNDSEGLYRKRDEAQEELDTLLERFGGDEGFRAMRIRKAQARELDLGIEALSEAVGSAMETAESDPGAAAGNQTVAETQEAVDSINLRIGEINRDMRALVNEDGKAELRQELETTQAKLDASVREWAMLSLSDAIIEECSDRFYSDLQPSVIKTANHYLDLMTEGRYRLASDPRDSELSIEDRKGKKYSAEWSSGLGDQVYLAVKMAIAKEMGSERMPFIMDDVLVRFDSRRKQGACRAILDFARDQQAIMFTCDSTLYSMFSIEGNVNLINLR